MSDNFNIDTTQAQSYIAGGLNPSDPTENIGEMIAKRGMQHQEQAQLVAQAVEKTKMARLGSKQKTEADDLGVNPETKDYMSKAEALSYIMHEWKVDETDPEVKQLAESLPEMVERHMIQTLIRKRDKSSGRAVGQPFKAAPNKLYPSSMDGGEPVDLEDGMWYQSYVTDEGSISYVPSGEASASLNHSMKDNQLIQRQWYKLVEEMDPTKASTRSGLGTAYRTLVNADRGISLLGMRKVTYQNLAEISRDLASILQGGVPSDSGSESMTFHSMMGDIAKSLQYMTGEPQQAIPEGLRSHLTDSFKRLKAISQDAIEYKVQQKEAALTDVIGAHENEWNNLKYLLMHPKSENSSAMNAEVDSHVPPEKSIISKAWGAMTRHDEGKPVDTVDKPVGNAHQTASGISYSVSE